MTQPRSRKTECLKNSVIAKNPYHGQQQPTGKILVLDVGGSHVKALVTGKRKPVKIESGPKLTPKMMLERLHLALNGWEYQRVSIGLPAPVIHGHVLHDPYNLGKGWVGFDFSSAFACPVRMINDAAMQALGSYGGGRMLFLGLGTGLGSAMIVDGLVEPMEIAHLPYRKHTYEYYVGEAARKRRGRKKWQENVYAIVESLKMALEPEYVVLGGGNVKYLANPPADVRLGSNENAFTGGFRLWDIRKLAPDAGSKQYGVASKNS